MNTTSAALVRIQAVSPCLTTIDRPLCCAVAACAGLAIAGSVLAPTTTAVVPGSATTAAAFIGAGAGVVCATAAPVKNNADVAIATRKRLEKNTITPPKKLFLMCAGFFATDLAGEV
jgi:hypothetical protein